VTTSGEHTHDSVAFPGRLGPYLIEKELGAGGMGAVYLAHHVETQQPVALKILPASLARESGFVARFEREIAAMQQLKSPNIIELYDHGEDNGVYYFAMEYVAGETLSQRLSREKRIPWREVIQIGVQVCRALKAAHNAGIVHRDLKPSNLLLDSQGEVKLGDFGIAQVFASSKLTVTGGILGTAEYMSPEQAHGKRANKQSDIYSLGAVLYVMLTGRPPFTGKSTLEVLQKHRFAQFDSPRRIVPEIPLWLDEVICKCLSKKPEDRYPDAYVLMLRLEEIPRKVDLQLSEFEDDAIDVTRETISATGPSGSQPASRSGGTLMRDLFRAEVESAQARGFWGGLFDNIWVLIGLLVLFSVGGVLVSAWTRPTPRQMLERGRQLMEQPEGEAWIQARDQYFNPLVEMDAGKWEPEVEPDLNRIRLYELKKQLLGRTRSREAAPRSEPESVMRQALELRRDGRVFEARQRLLALETLLEGDPEFLALRDMARALREEMDRNESPDRLDYVREALERADALAGQGKIAQARAIWRSVLDLYDADPEAAPLRDIAQRHLNAAPIGTPPQSQKSEAASPSPP
jgi:serine/threonine-protein kinase